MRGLPTHNHNCWRRSQPIRELVQSKIVVCLEILTALYSSNSALGRTLQETNTVLTARELTFSQQRLSSLNKDGCGILSIEAGQAQRFISRVLHVLFIIQRFLCLTRLENLMLIELDRCGTRMNLIPEIGPGPE